MESLQVVAISTKVFVELGFEEKQRQYTKWIITKGKQFPNLFLKIKINPNKQSDLSVYAGIGSRLQ
jgi:hypothetical protein